MEMTSLLDRAVCGAILYTADGRVLLQQRDDKPDIPYPGYWTFFGGAVEPDESPEAAIRRELLEELDLELPLAFWHDYVCPVRSKLGGVKTRNYIYLGLLTQPIDTLTLREGQAMRLFTPDEARKLDLAYQQSGVLRGFFSCGMNGGMCSI
jgi:8-oxo-dGTP diphosphatase